MQDLNDKITGNTLTATEWNEVPSEIQNVIEALGQTLSSGDLNQLGKGIAGYVANANFYTDTGIADAYVLTKIGSKQAATAYTNGFQASFLAGNTNTGASTVNIAGLGIKNIKTSSGGNPVAGDIFDRIDLIFDASNDWFQMLNPFFSRPPFALDTLADAVANTSLYDGATVILSGRNSKDDGGGAMWGVVLSSTVTENTLNIVQCTGVATLSLVLRLGSTDVITTLHLGIDASGASDVTAAIDVLMQLTSSPYLVAGSYLVDYVNIYENTHVKTDNKDTIITHKPQTGEQRIINVVGSNAHLETIKVTANIATDAGEQNHALYMDATGSGGLIENFSFEDLYVQDIRGDAVYFRGRNGATCRNIRGGNILGDNVYRNGVVAAGCISGSIDSIQLTNLSLLDFDAEPEPGYDPVDKFYVGYIKGGTIGVNSADPAVPSDSVEFGFVDVSNNGKSTPPYGGSSARYGVGVSFRNVKYVKFGKLMIRDYDLQGIRVIFNAGELGAGHIRIDDLDIATCSLLNTGDNNYIDSSNIEFLDIGKITAVVEPVSGTPKRLFYGPSGVGSLSVDSGDVSLGLDCVYHYSGKGSTTRDLEVTGTGIMFTFGSKNRVIGGSFVGKRISTSASSPIIMEHFTATASDVLFSGGDKHYAVNSTLNSDYFADGFTARDYTMTYRFGPNHLWIDSTGDVRTKSSAPASDTDGTVVGDQSL